MTVPILLFIVGLLLIIFAGDKFVDAAVSIAKSLHVSELIIGATIVSLGTTLPEVLVSTTAAFNGSADIAAGNAFGSIFCNTALICAITFVVSPPMNIDRSALGWRTFFFFAAAAITLIFGLGAGTYGLAFALIMLGMVVLYTIMNLRGTSEIPEDEDGSDFEKEPIIKPVIILVITAAALFVGARLLVNNGQIIAKALGVPERVIAVTFIALGTSLPELVTAISSLIKKHGSVSLGNILGANILNLLLVMGLPAAISGVTPSAAAVRLDLPIAMAAMAVMTIPVLINKRGYRIQGLVLIAGYIAYCIYQF